jgi:hypothetical protein
MNAVFANNLDVGVEHWHNYFPSFDKSLDLPMLYPLRS